MRSLCAALALGLSTTIAFAESSSDSLIKATVEHEHAIVTSTNTGRPLLETYLQFYNSDGSAPVSDKYILGELSSTHTLSESNSSIAHSLNLAKLISGSAKNIVHGSPSKILAEHFSDMVSPDTRGFDTNNYVFHYVRPAFIGSRRVLAFDVMPRDQKHPEGRFNGRIWIDLQDKVIVRFTGVFDSHAIAGRPEYLHFDSWRKKSLDTGEWRPYAVYMQDEVHGQIIRGQLHLWAYDIDHVTQGKDSFNTDIHVDNAEDKSGSTQDVSPIESQDHWRDQAEANVIERLETAGLLAKSGEFEKVLDQIVTNIEVPNNLAFTRPVKVRILLTLPVEATTVDHTILLSKGLFDTIPNEESLASIVALQLAHVALGHHLNTMFAFNDKLAFTNDSTYKRLRFSHNEEDNRAAAKLAGGYLAKSMYADKLVGVANYYAVMAEREATLKAISHGYLGDSLLGPDDKAWLTPVLPATTLANAHAYPAEEPTALGTMLSIDPESNSLSQILPRVAPGPGEAQRPLEIMPIWINFKSDQSTKTTLPSGPVISRAQN